MTVKLSDLVKYEDTYIARCLFFSSTYICTYIVLFTNLQQSI